MGGRSFPEKDWLRSMRCWPECPAGPAPWRFAGKLFRHPCPCCDRTQSGRLIRHVPLSEIWSGHIGETIFFFPLYKSIFVADLTSRVSQTSGRRWILVLQSTTYRRMVWMRKPFEFCHGAQHSRFVITLSGQSKHDDLEYININCLNFETSNFFDQN